MLSQFELETISYEKVKIMVYPCIHSRLEWNEVLELIEPNDIIVIECDEWSALLLNFPFCWLYFEMEVLFLVTYGFVPKI